MKPSLWSTLAKFSFNFELGILTLSNIAEFALRIRVSMSAIGSVIVMSVLPTRLRDAGNLTGVGHLRKQIRHSPNLRYTDRGRPQRSQRV